MKSKLNFPLELWMLGAGLICLVLFLSLPLIFPDPASLPSTYLVKLRYGAAAFYGASISDLSQDLVGARGLMTGQDPYPILGPALPAIGIEWDLDFRSPRLPTALLFVAPIAFLEWPLASAVWAGLMIGSWMLALRFLGLTWQLAIGLGGLLVLWPPAALSLGQLSALWLLLLAIAYTNRSTRRGLSGAAIAAAAMTKWTPALAGLNFAGAKARGRALAGFALAWVVGISAVVLIHPEAWWRYAEVSGASTQGLMARPDNAAPLAIAWRTLGWPGAIVWLGLLALLVAVHWPDLRANTTRGWMLSFYLAVAALPVLWVYSLLPLLPTIWYAWLNGGRWGRPLTLAAGALSLAGPGFGGDSVPFVAGPILLLGLAWLNLKRD